MITIYAVILDMEDDVPDAYVLSEELAKELVGDSDIADYIALEVDTGDWMALLVGHETSQ